MLAHNCLVSYFPPYITKLPHENKRNYLKRKERDKTQQKTLKKMEKKECLCLLESFNRCITTQFRPRTRFPANINDILPLPPIPPLQSLIPFGKYDVKHDTRRTESPFPCNRSHTISVSNDVDDDDEGEKGGGSHDDSVDNNIGCEFLVENSRNDIMRRSMHNIKSSRLQSQTILAPFRSGGGTQKQGKHL